MDAAGQQFVQQWYQYLQQQTVRVQQLLQEADTGAQQMLRGNATDPLTLQNALQAITLQIKDIQTQLGTTWGEAILSQLMGSKDNREPIDLAELDSDEVLAAAPEVVLLMPCGYSAAAAANGSFVLKRENASSCP